MEETKTGENPPRTTGRQSGSNSNAPGDGHSNGGKSNNGASVVDRRRMFRRRKKPRQGFEWPKQSVFDTTCVVDETKGSMKYLVHRLVYISKIQGVNTDRKAIGEHCDQLTKRLMNDYHSSEHISGLMLIYLKHIVHVIETSSDMLYKIMEDLQRTETDPESFIAKSKILVISHDVHPRLYQQWNYRLLDIVEHGIEAFDTNESIENLTVDLLTQLLKLGTFIMKQPKLNLKNAMDSLHDKVPELLPQQSIVNYLLEENDEVLLTPTNFIDMYTKPFDTSLESDMVWPIPTRLFPYN